MDTYTKEIWKDIPGFEGVYRASNLGNISVYERKWVTGKNLHRYKPAHNMKLVLTHKGYICVTLCKDGISKYYSVHQLIAKTFLPNPENKTHVNHKNGKKCDNVLENLEWCTQLENNIHALKTGLRINPSGSDNGYSVKVKAIKGDTILGEYETIKECANKLGISYYRAHRLSQNKIKGGDIKIIRA